MLSLITKQTFLSARICPMLGWYLCHGIEARAPSEGDRFRAEQGQRIGELARRLHPDGVLISATNVTEAAASTELAMADPGTPVLFEAAFVTGDYVARADILRRAKSGWELHEVKMSLEDTEELPRLIDDLAYTVMVARRCGVLITRACLLLISRSCRKTSSPSEIFVELDQTGEVEKRLMEFTAFWPTVEATTTSESAPEPKLLCDCRGCEFFDSHCLGKGHEHHVLHLPNLHKTKIARLSEMGAISIKALPADFALTDLQQRAVTCIKSRKPHVGASYKAGLSAVEWPVHYLDFESVMTAIPLYDTIAPYEQIVTQFSIHTCSAPGVIISHAQYLADAERDCQRELAERLLADLGADGTIVVYSSFEAVRISALANRFPDLASPLRRLKERLVDLLPIIRRGFYHHSLRGSFSIKQLLPAVVPNMSYDGLAIAEGDSAVAQFARMAMSRLDSASVAQIRADLLTYCCQDTRAMVELHAALLHHE